MSLAEDIDSVQEAISTHENWEAYRRPWLRLRAKLEVADRAAPNTGSPKLPTLAEVESHVQRELWSGAIDCESMNIVQVAYEFITRQLRAGA